MRLVSVVALSLMETSLRVGVDHWGVDQITLQTAFEPNTQSQSNCCLCGFSACPENFGTSNALISVFSTGFRLV